MSKSNKRRSEAYEKFSPGLTVVTGAFKKLSHVLEAVNRKVFEQYVHPTKYFYAATWTH